MHPRTKLWSGVLAASLFACATPSPQDIHLSDMHRRIGQAKLQKGQLELALREYRAAVDFNPEDAENYFGLAETYRRKGMLEEAETALLEALRVNPEHQDARLNLSVVYLEQERWEDAIAEATTLIADPTFLRPSRALVNRGWAYYNSGNLEGAESDLREALVSDGGNFMVHLDLGRVLYDRGEVLDSMLHFEKVVELVERRPPEAFGAAEAQARFHLAQAHVKLGQRKKAIEQLRAAVKRGGEDEWARKSSEYLGLLE